MSLKGRALSGQGQGHLGESRVDMGRLSWAAWGREREGERERAEPDAAVKRAKV